MSIDVLAWLTDLAVYRYQVRMAVDWLVSMLAPHCDQGEAMPAIHDESVTLDAVSAFTKGAQGDEHLRLMEGIVVAQGQGGHSVADTRAALVLLLIARCNMEQAALHQAGGEALFAELLRDSDARVRYHASMFVQQRLIATKSQQYRRALRQLTLQAQQANDEKLLRNPYLQISAMLEMRLIDLSF